MHGPAALDNGLLLPKWLVWLNPKKSQKKKYNFPKIYIYQSKEGWTHTKEILSARPPLRPLKKIPSPTTKKSNSKSSMQNFSPIASAQQQLAMWQFSSCNHDCDILPNLQKQVWSRYIPPIIIHSAYKLPRPCYWITLSIWCVKRSLST